MPSGNDFDNNKSYKQENDYIRRHITLVESQNAPYTTDALPFSAAELIEGKISEPTISSHYDIATKNFEQHSHDYDENIAL